MAASDARRPPVAVPVRRLAQPPALPPRQRGVSLIEALIALAVMSLGILALVGVQATLRFNADTSRQRAEAARIAATQIEQMRQFRTIQPVGGQANPSWSEIVTGTDNNIVLVNNANSTTYNVTRTITAANSGPGRLVAEVVVSWSDRNNTSNADNQEVRVSTLITAAEPVLGALLAVPASPSATNRNLGRHASIPVEAKEIDVQQSAFKPFDSGTTVWVFNNATGYISSLCTGINTAQALISKADLAACTTIDGRLLAGTVRFDTTAAVSASNPAGTVLPLNPSTPMSFSATDNISSSGCVAGTVAPLGALPPSAVRYYCYVVPVDAKGWGGQLDVSPDTTQWTLGNVAGTYKVCRYTPYNSDATKVDFTANAHHPKFYCKVDSTSCTKRVTGNLLNQNFLVIPATASCPSDNRTIDIAAGVQLTFNTVPHQP